MSSCLACSIWWKNCVILWWEYFFQERRGIFHGLLARRQGKGPGGKYYLVVWVGIWIVITKWPVWSGSEELAWVLPEKGGLHFRNGWNLRPPCCSFSAYVPVEERCFRRGALPAFMLPPGQVGYSSLWASLWEVSPGRPAKWLSWCLSYLGISLGWFPLPCLPIVLLDHHVGSSNPTLLDFTYLFNYPSSTRLWVNPSRVESMFYLFLDFHYRVQSLPHSRHSMHGDFGIIFIFMQTYVYINYTHIYLLQFYFWKPFL